MKLLEMLPGEKHWIAFDPYVIAVLSRRVDGWCVYIGRVLGERHTEEWKEVADRGTKLPINVAKTIAEDQMGFDTEGCPYAR